MTCHYVTSAGTCVSGLVGGGPVDERVVDEGFEQRQQRLAALPHRLQYVLARQPEQTLHRRVHDVTECTRVTAVRTRTTDGTDPAHTSK